MISLLSDKIDIPYSLTIPKTQLSDLNDNILPPIHAYSRYVDVQICCSPLHLARLNKIRVTRS